MSINIGKRKCLNQLHNVHHSHALPHCYPLTFLCFSNAACRFFIICPPILLSIQDELVERLTPAIQYIALMSKICSLTVFETKIYQEKRKTSKLNIVKLCKDTMNIGRHVVLAYVLQSGLNTTVYNCILNQQCTSVDVTRQDLQTKSHHFCPNILWQCKLDDLQ